MKTAFETLITILKAKRCYSYSTDATASTTTYTVATRAHTTHTGVAAARASTTLLPLQLLPLPPLV